MAQELTRHSDRRLTDQVYLYTSLLPLQETMRSIDGFASLTQILTHFSGKTGRLRSRVGEVGEEGETAGSPLTVSHGRSLTQPVGRLRWRDRRDSNLKSICNQVVDSQMLKEFTEEQWTQIWTQISDEDRQLLTRIVKRWGILSEELKRAVLRVVG